MADVFLSYAHEDLSAAARLIDELRRSDLKVATLDDLPVGRPWAESLNEAISRSRVFLLLIPAKAEESVRQEAALAIQLSLNTGLPFLPILLPGRRPTSDVSRFQYLAVDSEQGFGFVARTVRDLLDNRVVERSTLSAARESVWSELLASDLAKAPRAASIVLDQISQEYKASNRSSATDLGLLTQAAAWGTEVLGVAHPSVLLLQSSRLAALERSQDYLAVIRLCQELLRHPSSKQQRVRLLLSLGTSLTRVGQYAEADLIFTEAAQLSFDLASTQLRATAISRHAEALELQGRLSEAFDQYQQVVRLTTPLPEQGVRASALIGLCRIADRVVGNEQARSIADEALWLANSPLAGEWSEALTRAAQSVRGLDQK